ncbi:hypothetical protein FHR81_003217 [Actinoalloteichus hoggarensis]|uniref:DUF6884 domain-containing protein n=1 Tax=Actinoalloteichus hoggarensis TaxID=1470176 RepID=A0A221W7B0_9PSEU|nr:DUF6884 domain-containing protein [Actinoalloteichus hoggarensis]ASO21573.1 hypothetical protein AHOG_19775 [Actinoalloteichus hoggarensis]MBB5922165.1 hypothetical protein [Actinoalloteichus hoggarensis]
MTTLLAPSATNRRLTAAGGLIIVGCSRRKLDTTDPVPALRLYQGGCVPQLREHLAERPDLRARVRILSAEHGLLHPDQPITPYDHRITSTLAARRLGRRVGPQLDTELAADSPITDILTIVEPLYLVALTRLFDHLDRIRLTCLPDPRGWAAAEAVLDDWGWR